MINAFLAAFKVIKGWLPPAAVKKIKFLTKTNMNEYVSDENRLEEWGGTDPWTYVWEPETCTEGESEKRNILSSANLDGIWIINQYFAYLTRMNPPGLTRPRIAFIARPPSQLYTSKILKPNTT